MNFSIGEIVIGIDLDSYPELNGTEGTVLEYLPFHQGGWNARAYAQAPAGPKYRVKWHLNGLIALASPRHLRKKPPPEYLQVVTWSDCIWRPKELVT